MTKMSAVYAKILCICLGLDAGLGSSLGPTHFPGGRKQAWPSE